MVLMEPRERTLSFSLFCFICDSSRNLQGLEDHQNCPLEYLYLQGWMSERIGILFPSSFSLKRVSQAMQGMEKVKNFLASILTNLFICISLCSSREARLSTGHRNLQQAKQAVFIIMIGSIYNKNQQAIFIVIIGSIYSNDKQAVFIIRYFPITQSIKLPS